jgi:hypothetical protein
MKIYNATFSTHLDAFPRSISPLSALYYLKYQIVVKINPKVLYGITAT